MLQDPLRSSNSSSHVIPEILDFIVFVQLFYILICVLDSQHYCLMQ